VTWNCLCKSVRFLNRTLLFYRYLFCKKRSVFPLFGHYSTYYIFANFMHLFWINFRKFCFWQLLFTRLFSKESFRDIKEVLSIVEVKIRSNCALLALFWAPVLSFLAPTREDKESSHPLVSRSFEALSGFLLVARGRTMTTDQHANHGQDGGGQHSDAGYQSRRPCQVDEA